MLDILKHLTNDHNEMTMFIHLWQGIGPFVVCKCKECIGLLTRVDRGYK